MIVLAVVLTGLVVFAVVKALHYSSAPTTPSGIGEFTPKNTAPVAFSLQPLTASGHGPKTTMSSLVGTPLVLNMWSSTCVVCKSESPAIESVAKTLGGRVRFIGVDSADERGAALAFLHKYGVTYPQLFDPTAVVATGYGIPGLPVTVFISAAGKVVGENVGALSVTTLRHYLSVLFHE
jgi:thiol-disulfide isomerase/thioredoxin